MANDEAMRQALGQSGLSAGDTDAYLQIVVEEINATGGLAGLEVVPVVFTYDGLDPGPVATQDQAACSMWTEDTQVFAAFGVGGGSNDTLTSCLGDHGVPIVTGGLTEADAETFRLFPYYVDHSGVSQTRIARLLASGLDAQGYYEPEDPVLGTRIGVLSWDTPEYNRAVEDVLKPALADIGQEVVAQAAIAQPGSAAEQGDYFAAIENAVLRFRTENVNHVLILESSASITLYFQLSAENQQYRPQYGLNSQNGPQALLGLTPVEQMRTANVVGWIPLFDVGADEQPEDNATRARCRQIMEANGQEAADVNNQAVIYAYCGDFFFAQQAMQGLADLTPDGLVNAINQVGTAWEPLGTFTSRLDAAHHDGGSSFRGAAFFDDCGCFRYTTEILPIPET